MAHEISAICRDKGNEMREYFAEPKIIISGPNSSAREEQTNKNMEEIKLAETKR